MATAAGGSGSQTLDRGIRVLEVLSEAEEPLALPELCSRMGLHRSVVYRLLRTLEEHGLAVRDADGRVRLGLGLAALSRSVQRDLQTVAVPELTRVANAVRMTTFLTVLADDLVLTLVSAEPANGAGVVAQRPGSRHRLDVGAPGAVIRAQLTDEELTRFGLDRVPASAGPSDHAVSTDEVIPGLQSVAVPLSIPGEAPAALAVVHVSGAPVDQVQVVALLHQAAESIGAALV